MQAEPSLALMMIMFVPTPLKPFLLIGAFAYIF